MELEGTTSYSNFNVAVVHGHILTNYCRIRWGWVYHPRVPVENEDVIVLHVFRDCTQTHWVWNRLVSSD